jgi:hypothetical protein
MEKTNDSKLEDDFNCEGGITWGKSTPSSINKKKYEFSNQNAEEGIYYEPHFNNEMEIPYDYEWESYTETH